MASQCLFRRVVTQAGPRASLLRATIRQRSALPVHSGASNALQTTMMMDPRRQSSFAAVQSFSTAPEPEESETPAVAKIDTPQPTVSREDEQREETKRRRLSEVG